MSEHERVFGYTAEQVLQVATDYVGEQLDDCLSVEEGYDLLANWFPTGERPQPEDPLEVARALLEDRDKATHERNGGRVRVEQFKAWCQGGMG